ncbi:MAG TPA: TolC family protein [Gemmatimonadales bacterium]
MLLLLAALQMVGADTVRQISLEEALRLGTQLDPGYVTALGQVRNATWQRRAAFTTFILPSVVFQTAATRYSSDAFNIGTLQPASQIVTAQLSANYDLFRGGAKFFELARARADFESAEASALQARYRTALLIEADYYDVLAQQELTRVSEERVRRAAEQLTVARARVVSGAAVQTDSLQLLLELTRARVDLLRQRSSLTVARLQLGRRVGLTGPAAAAPVDAAPPALPLSVDAAVAEAIDAGPSYQAARAKARAASASARSGWSLYLPQITLNGLVTAFDDRFFPNATTRSSLGISFTLPLWNNGQREIALSQARVARDIAAAVADDAARAARRDVVEAYEAYTTAQASSELARQQLAVAGENLRVQQERYRAGATTILDLVTAQVSITEAEAGVVQARYAARLALAGLEAILGRRLFAGER